MVELNIPRCRELIVELRDLPNDYIAYAEELCPEVADQLEAALAEVERLNRCVMHEDDLPEMTDAEYAQWFEHSWIPGGVGCRVGPVILKRQSGGE